MFNIYNIQNNYYNIISHPLHRVFIKKQKNVKIVYQEKDQDDENNLYPFIERKKSQDMNNVFKNFNSDFNQKFYNPLYNNINLKNNTKASHINAEKNFDKPIFFINKKRNLKLSNEEDFNVPKTIEGLLYETIPIDINNPMNIKVPIKQIINDNQDEPENNSSTNAARVRPGRIKNTDKKPENTAVHNNTKADNLQNKAQKTYFKLIRILLEKTIAKEGYKLEKSKHFELKKISTVFTNDIWKTSLGKFDETLYDLYTKHGIQGKQRKNTENEDTINFNKNIFDNILDKDGFTESKILLNMTFRDFLDLIKTRKFEGLSQSTIDLLPTIDALVDNEKNNERGRLLKISEVTEEFIVNKVNELSFKYRKTLEDLELLMKGRKGRKNKRKNLES